MRLVLTSAVTEVVSLATPAPKPSEHPWDDDEILERYYKNFFIQSDCRKKELKSVGQQPGELELDGSDSVIH